MKLRYKYTINIDGQIFKLTEEEIEFIQEQINDIKSFIEFVNTGEYEELLNEITDFCDEIEHKEKKYKREGNVYYIEQNRKV